MPDYAAPVALGIKVPDAMANLGSVMGAANSMQALKGAQFDLAKKQATLGADIAKNQAESDVAVGTVAPRITSAQESAKQSQIATHVNQYKFDAEKGQHILQLAGGLAADPDVIKAEGAKTPDELSAASSKVTDAVLAARDRAYELTGDRKKVDVQFAPIIAKAAHAPNGLRSLLMPIILGGQGAGQQSATITPATAAINTGQRTDVINTGQNPFSPPPAAAPMVSVPNEVPVTQPIYNPTAQAPGIVGPQPRPGASIPKSVQSQRDAESLILLKDERAKATNPADQAALDREIAARSRTAFIQTGPSLGEPAGADIMPAAVKVDWDKTLAASSVAQQNIGVLNNIKKYSEGAIKGFAADRRSLINSLGDALGISGDELTKTNTDLLAKNANMLALVGGNTDAARALAEAANPNIHMNGPAIKHAADQIIAQNKMALEKARFLRPALGNADEYNKKLVEWNAVADPRVLQLQSMSPEEKAALRKSDEWPQFKAKAQKLHDIGVSF